MYRSNVTNNSSSGYFTGSSNPSNHYKAHLFCDYCKKSGHTEEKCYRLHGFPQDFKFTKGRRVGGTTTNVLGNTGGLLDENCENVHLKGPNHTLTHSLTQDQYNQLLNLLGSIHNHGAGTSDGHKESANDLNNAHGAVNLAGILACHSSITKIGNLSCRCVDFSANSWIIDSGATNHMTYNKTLLTKIRPLPYPFLVTLPNGYKVKVTEIGDAYLSPALTLHKVLIVPSFKFNLISVHCLTSQLKGIVSFSSSSCLIQGPSLKSPLEIGRARNGLYFTCPRCLTCSTNTSSSPVFSFPVCSDSVLPSVLSNKTNSSCIPSVRSIHDVNKRVGCNHLNSVNSSCFANSPISCTSHGSVDHLWHTRLGHVPFGKMKGISTIPFSFAPKQPFTCTV